MAVLTQTKRNRMFFKENLEVIVLDLGSKENLETELKKFPFVSYHYIDYNGTFSKSWALNLAFKLSRFQWVFTLDVDCIFMERFIKNVTALINPEKKDHVYCFGGIRSLDADITRLIQEKSIITNNVKAIIQQYYNDLENMLGYGNLILHREMYEKITGFDEKMIGWGREDSDFYSRLQRAGVHTETFPDDPDHALFHLDHYRGDVTYNNRLIFYPNDFTESYNNREGIIKANLDDQWGEISSPPSQYRYESLIDFHVQEIETAIKEKGNQTLGALTVNGIPFDNPNNLMEWQNLFLSPDSDTPIAADLPVIILGGGLNYAAKALIDKGMKVIVIEKYKRIRELACQWNHLDPSCFLDTDFQNLTARLMEIREMNPKTILTHKPSLQFDREWYQTVKSFIQPF